MLLPEKQDTPFLFARRTLLYKENNNYSVFYSHPSFTHISYLLPLFVICSKYYCLQSRLHDPRFKTEGD